MSILLKSGNMWRNFLYVALRRIENSWIFSLINMIGLAVGLSSAILIILFISREISFDRYLENSDRIYRIYIDGKSKDQTYKGAWTSYPIAPAAAAEIDEIIDFTRIDIYPKQLIWRNNIKAVEEYVVFADSGFFKIFSNRILLGDKNSLLTEPGSVVITSDKAKQYFGDENPVGQTLEFNNPGNKYLVTGVMENFPDNSHFYCDFVLSMVSLEQSKSKDWLSNSIYSYILLEKDVDYKKVEKELNELNEKKLKSEIKSILDITFEQWTEDGNSFNVFLQPITSIHLNPEIEIGTDYCFRPVNDRVYIYIFLIIALFVLLIAGINFTNLSTARSGTRWREIGIRKALGSTRNGLIGQFLSESIILSILALFIALFLVEITLPWANRSIGLLLNFKTVGSGKILMGIILLTLFVGFLSGLYPALYLSKYELVQGFRDERIKSVGSSLFRSIMVVVQFTISIAIIAGTLIVSRQVNYLSKKDPGFDKNQMLILDRIYPLGDKLEEFCMKINDIPGVEMQSKSSSYLGFSNLYTAFQIKGRARSSNFMFDVNFVEPNILETYGLTLKNKAKELSFDELLKDTMSIIINNAAVEEYNLKDPLNTVFQHPTAEGKMLDYKVVGVVEDFHYSSMRKPISPYMFMCKTKNNSDPGFINIKLDKDCENCSKVIKEIYQLWYKMTGDEPFQYFFLDEELDKYYEEERKISKLSFMFSILAILIATLGLFGLTLFNTQRRIREIAIRKAMGAGIINLLYLLSKEVFILLGISVIPAWLISFLVMKKWLLNFPFNIGFTPGIYLLAAVITFIVAMITVNVLTFRVAKRDPAISLYHE